MISSYLDVDIYLFYAYIRTWLKGLVVRSTQQEISRQIAHARYFFHVRRRKLHTRGEQSARVVCTNTHESADGWPSGLLDTNARMTGVEGRETNDRRTGDLYEGTLKIERAGSTFPLGRRNIKVRLARKPQKHAGRFSGTIVLMSSKIKLILPRL